MSAKFFLGAGDDELDYCAELCSGLASVVQGVSDQKSNSVKSTAILEKELANTNLQLGEARKNQAQCQQSKENIDGFQVYLESLDKEIKLRHKAVRDAEAALDAAEWALDDLAQKLGSQRQSVLDATELLTGSQASVKDAKEEFEGIVKDEDLFLKQIERAIESLGKLREDLTNLKKASEVILDIKKYVSATTLKMGYLMDVAVREPVRQIGLVEETNVWDYFSDQVATQQCSADFKQQLGDFHGYCTGPAMAGFEKVKKFVDLTPLCKLDDKTKIATEEDAAVQTRIGLLTDDLKEVQSWLDPFKGTDMTLTKERQKVEEGEPEGLRQVMGVYGKTNFYTEYLKEWKVKKGKFHKLLAQLKAKIESLDEDIKQAEDELRELTDALALVLEAKEKARQKLQVALADEEAALDGKAELEKAVATLEIQIEETKNMLIDLQDQVSTAKRLYLEARKKLVTEHGAGLEGLSLEQSHEGMLND